MQRIDLDFARTPKRPFWPWLLLLAGSIALAAAIAGHRMYWQPRLAADEGRLRAAQTALNAKRPPAVRIDDAQLAAEWSRAIAVAGQLKRPWEQLFAIFEAEVERPVAILSFEPDVGKGELVLTAEARNFDAMLDYYRMLQLRDNLSAVALHAHQVNQQDKDKPIRFRITAKWAVNA